MYAQTTTLLCSSSPKSNFLLQLQQVLDHMHRFAKL